MINYRKGNIFLSRAQTLVNPVNTVGVMGKGLAKDFKDKYSLMYSKYKDFCKSGKFDVGKLLIYQSGDKKIILFPTKKHWKDKSKIEYIELGLDRFVKRYKNYSIRSVAFPKLGCGLGGLNWDKDVKKVMEKYLNNLDIEVYIYV